jgi:predicted HTH domain antitoxin
MAITIELPRQLEQQLQAEWADLERHALEGLVVEAFRSGKLSSHEVGEALGMQSRWEAENFLSERGAYPGYDLEDLQQDRQTLERTAGKG